MVFLMTGTVSNLNYTKEETIQKLNYFQFSATPTFTEMTKSVVDQLTISNSSSINLSTAINLTIFNLFLTSIDKCELPIFRFDSSIVC